MPNKTPLRDVLRDDHRGGRLKQVDDMVAGRGAHAGRTPATLSQTGAPMPARQAPAPGPMDNLNKYIGKARKVLGLRDGMAIVRGPGGPTGDKIPAKLSDGEAVLPADTVAAVGPDNIQALIDATHTKGKTSVAGGVLRAAGGYSPNRQMRDGIKPNMDMAREQILRDQDAARLRQARAASQAAGVQHRPAPTALDPHAQRVVQDAQRRSAEVRARMSAPSAAAPAAAAPAAPKPPGRLAQAGRATLRGVGSTVTPIIEGARTIKDYNTPGMTADEQMGRVGEAGTRLATTAGGAMLGQAAIPVPGVGAIIGGAAGFFAPDLVQKAGEAMGVNNNQLPSQRAAALRAGATDPTRVNMITGSSGQVPDSALRNPAGGGQAPGTFTTGDGRQGYLPPGISAGRDAQGNLVASGNAASIYAATGQDPRALQTATMSAANSPLRPNIGEMGSNFAPVSSRASAINKQFDDLAKQIQQAHGGARFQARGTMATKLLELEKARAAALGQDQGAMVDGQGNQVADLNSKRGAETSLYGTDMGFEASTQRNSALRDAAGMRSQADLYRAQQEAIRENQSAVLAQTTAEAERLFPDDPKAQQAYIDDRYQRTPGLASGAVGAAEAAIVSGQDRPYSTNKIRANERGNAKAEDFVAGGPATRLPFANAMEMGIAKGLDAYADSALSSILPSGDSGAYYIEPGDTREARVLPADGMTIDEERAILRRQGKKR